MEYLNSNEYRFYPFREPSEIKVLSLTLFISTRYVLPIYIKKYTKQGEFITLTLFDANNTYIGVFDSNSNLLLLPNEECGGKIEFGDNSNTMDAFNQDCSWSLELSCIKLFPKYKVKELKINDEKMTGTITLKDSLNMDVSIENGHLDLTAKNIFDPKCPSPILTINGVTPNSEGVILLESTSSHVSLVPHENAIIEITSDLNIQDFDGRALTGPKGKTGPAGNDGTDGRDGVAYPVNPTPPNDRFNYNGGYFDRNNFNTINLLGTWVYGGYIFSPTMIWEIDLSLLTSQWRVITPIDRITCVGHTDGTTYYGTLNGYICDMVTSVKVSSHRILSVIDFDNWHDTERVVLNGVILPGTDVNKIKKIDEDIFILRTTNFEVKDKYTSNTGTSLNDTDGTWVIGDVGKLYKIEGVGIVRDFSIVLGTVKDLVAIDDGIIVGDSGVLYSFYNSRFNFYQLPTVKDWKSVWKETSERFWIFGS